jgi:hypothetical protein
MPQVDPSLVIAQTVFPRPAAGFRRQVQITHPFCGSLGLLTNDASVNESNSPNFTKYVATPAFGPKQKTIHSAGTKEINWSVGGEVTNSSLGLVRLMQSAARGVSLSSLGIQQGIDGFWFDNPIGACIPWMSFSLSGNQNAGLSFTLEGRSTRLPVPVPGLLSTAPDVQVPSWATGNNYILSWSLSHNTNLQAFWGNTPTMLPAYYRPGESEYSLQLTMSVFLVEHTLIRIALGQIHIFEAVVTSRNRTFGDRNSPVTYQVTSTNAKVSDQNGYTDFVDVIVTGGSSYAGYS